MLFKVALAQIDCKVGDKEYNCKKFNKYSKKAKSLGAKLVIFPEMSDIGYDTSYFKNSSDTWEKSNKHSPYNLAKKASIDNEINLICGISEKENNEIYNSIAVFSSKGELLTKYRKTHLFTPSPVCEDKFCKKGNEISLVEIEGIKFGLSICYDLRFPELYRLMALSGASVFINCTAWPESRHSHWDSLTKARAIENQAFFIGVDRVGVDSKLKMNGRSRIVSPKGEVLIEGSLKEEELLIKEINLEEVNKFREEIPIFDNRRMDIYGNLNFIE